MILLACTVALAVAPAPKLSSLSFVFLLITAFPVLTLCVPRTCPAEEQELISILNFNTEFQHNDHYDLFDQVVIKRQPDVIALVEINKKWIDNIEKTTKPYVYNKIVLKGPGMALFSKYPIEKCDVRFFGKSHHPRILATLLVKGKRLDMVIVHPTTPQSEAGYRERNQEFELIGSELDKLPKTKILMGDLNCGPWSPEFKALLSHGLNDSQKGFGPQPSWPARFGRIAGLPIPPLIPIDHVLISEDLCATERSVGPAMQSDHLPVFVQLRMAKEKPVENN